MTTGYEADFYRQFAVMTKDVHRIAFATEGVVVTLEKLVKQLEENNVSRDPNDQSETTLVEAIQNLTDMVSDSCQTVEYTQILDRIATALEKGRLR